MAAAYGSGMASSKRRRPKDRRRSGATGSRNPQVQHAPSPKARLAKLFKLMGQVTEAAQKAVLSTPDATEPVVRFDIEVLLRGANSVKAVRVLLEQGHWEHAVGITRQLFELLVNMEYLGKQSDRGEATLRFARFGLLQFVLAEQRKIEYDQGKGRPIDPAKAALVDHHLMNDFTDFQAKPKPDGSVRWVDSWCRQKVQYLAEQSGDPMRVHQYEILFRVWSEEAHATPGALIKSLFRDNDDGWVDRAIAENDQWSKDTLCFTLMFFMRLWLELPHVSKDVQQIDGWLRALTTHYGAPELGPLPVNVSEAK
jgi:hypothetical protein